MTLITKFKDFFFNFRYFSKVVKRVLGTYMFSVTRYEELVAKILKKNKTSFPSPPAIRALHTISKSVVEFYFSQSSCVIHATL